MNDDLTPDSSGEPSRRGGSKGERVRRTRRRRRSTRPPEAEQPPSSTRRALTWAVTIIGSTLAAFATYFLLIYPLSTGPGAGKAVEIVIDHDEPVTSVIDKLDRGGLLRSRTKFAVYARLVAPRFSPGAHLVTDDVGPQELVRRLERLGAAAKAKLTIPEGWNRFEIAKRVESLHLASQASFLAATTDAALLRELALDGESVEGFLFPATYELPQDSDPKDLVRRLKAEFDRRFSLLEQNHQLGRAQLESSLGWSRREIVTLASMVEKEAAVDEERPLVASVFLNRLRDVTWKRKVLQSDPTSGYGCLVLRERVPACASYSGKITHGINVDPANTYSTYVHEGLPPGPIANPGSKSIEAVLSPASTKYLYFVTRTEGRRHAFSETLEEHNTAVKGLRERAQKAHEH